MKKLAMFGVCALLAITAVGCASGYRQDSKGEVYTKSSFIGNDAPRPVQQQQPVQQMQYHVAE